MPVLMGDDDGSWRRSSTEEGQLEGQLEDMRFDRDCARATIAEQNKRILALEEQLAEARKDLDARDEADIASPAPTPAAEDDKGGVKALSTPARPTLERQIASVSRQFWEKHEEGKLRKIKDRTNKPSPLPQPSPPAEEG